MIVPNIDAMSSTVDTTGLAIPAVAREDFPLTRTLEPCTKPAIPPPAIIASVHLNKGDTSPTIDAVVIVPAITAAV